MVNSSSGASQNFRAIADKNHRIPLRTVLHAQKHFSQTCKLRGKVRPSQKWNIGIILVLGLTGTIAPLPATAQITPDNTLGNESSRVTTNVNVRGGNADRIDGGAVRGSNLFHSFLEMNVTAGQRVYFANPAGVENILSRVTGNTRSNIQGLLGVDGSANLFLLNPNGIIFGPNARLDISGSFTASTANRFTFSDGSEFSAINPGAPPLLTVSAPVGLQYGVGQRGDITNAGQLAVSPGQFLTLYGGVVRSSGILSAPGGTVQVLGDRVALIDNAQIDVSSDTGGGTIFVGGAYRGQDTVPSALRTFVGSGVTMNADARISGNGGRVIVWSNEATGFYGDISARGGSLGGNGGFVEVSGRQNLAFDGRVDVGAIVGQSGNLLLDPENVTIAAVGEDDGELTDNQILFEDSPGNTFTISDSAVASALENGDVEIQANNRITVNGAYIDVSTPYTLTLSASDITLDNASIYQSGGGSIFLNTDNNRGSSVTLNQSNVGTTTFGVPLGGDINIYASGAIRLINDSNLFGGVGEGTSVSATGGNINIYGGSFLLSHSSIGNYVQDFGQVPDMDINGNTIQHTAQNVLIDVGRGSIVIEDPNQQDFTRGIFVTLGNGSDTGFTTRRGVAGNITLRSGSVLIDGLQANSPSGEIAAVGIAAKTFGIGDAGSIDIHTGELIVRNGGFIDSGTTNQGNAGRINILANSVSLLNDRQERRAIQNTTDPNGNSSSSGIGGSIRIETNSLRLENAAISAETRGNGNGGSISLLPVPNRQSLTVNLGENSRVSAATFSSGQGGSVSITAPDSVLLTGGGLVTVQSNPEATGRGGNLSIATERLTIDGGTQVSVSTASSGNGGNVTIEADRLNLFSGSTILAETRGTGLGGNINFRPNTNGRSLAVNLNSNSQISASAFGIGDGGSIEITAPDSITLGGNGELSATARGLSDAGSVTIRANNAIFSGSQVSTRNPSSTFSAGDISITGDDRVLISNGSNINSDGLGGNITVDAPNEVRISNGTLSATSSSTSTESFSGIQIGSESSSPRSVILDNATLTTTNEGTGYAGNISVNAIARVLISDSRINSNGLQGKVIFKLEVKAALLGRLF